MSIKIIPEEINILILKYLEESGFSHSAFTFLKESKLKKSKYFNKELPSNMLITLLEKLLIYLELESHMESIEKCNEEFTFLTSHVCRLNTFKNEEQNKQTDEFIVENEIKNDSLFNNSKITEIEKFKNGIKSSYLSNNSNLSLIMEDSGKVVLYKINKFCEKIGELPHLSINNSENIFDLVNVEFDTNGKYISTICSNNILRIWDSSGLLVNFREPQGNIRKSTFSKQENVILYLVENEIVIWNFRTNINIQVYSNIINCQDVVWRNSNEFVSIHGNGFLKYFALSLSSPYKNIEFEKDYYLDQFLFSNNYIALVLRKANMPVSKLILWQSMTGQKIEEFDFFSEKLELIGWIKYSLNFPHLAVLIDKTELKFILVHPNKKIVLIESFKSQIEFVRISESTNNIILADKIGNFTRLSIDSNSNLVNKNTNKISEDIINMKWNEKETSVTCVTSKGIKIISDY